MYFDQMLFLLPHLEDRETHSNLSGDRSEHEDDAHRSQEEQKKPCRNVRKKQKEISYEEALLQILRKKNMDDVDEDKCFLLSLLPSFRQFNDDQKYLARMEILKIMRQVKLNKNVDMYAPCSSVPSFPNAN
jgi:hypothetical protein